MQYHLVVAVVAESAVAVGVEGAGVEEGAGVRQENAIRAQGRHCHYEIALDELVPTLDGEHHKRHQRHGCHAAHVHFASHLQIGLADDGARGSYPKPVTPLAHHQTMLQSCHDRWSARARVAEEEVGPEAGRAGEVAAQRANCRLLVAAAAGRARWRVAEVVAGPAKWEGEGADPTLPRGHPHCECRRSSEPVVLGS